MTEKAITIRNEAIKLALRGGRKFGQSEHVTACKNIVQRLIAFAVAEEPEAEQGVEDATEALCSMFNQSALQQKLAKAGVIDRAEKGKHMAALDEFASLKS